MTAIRPATIADAEGIARVHVAAWRETYRGLVPQAALDELSVEGRAAGWRDWLGDATRPPIVRVAEGGERGIVAFVSGGKARDPKLGTDGELSAIYLLDAVKRRGIGRRLFFDLAETLRTKGFRALGLWVFVDNGPARAFYDAMGGRTGAIQGVDFGTAVLDEIAYAWDDLSTLVPRSRS